MEFDTKLTCLGFLLAISTVTSSLPAQASSELSHTSIESRLSRLTTIMKERQLDPHEEHPSDRLMVGGWANGSHRGWVDTHRGDFANRHGGGGFVNRNWGDGGRFYNNYRGGGFVNRY